MCRTSSARQLAPKNSPAAPSTRSAFATAGSACQVVLAKITPAITTKITPITSAKVPKLLWTFTLMRSEKLRSWALGLTGAGAETWTAGRADTWTGVWTDA